LGLDLSTDRIFLNTVDVCATDVKTKQKILLTCPLSKSLAFWGVRGLLLAHSPEVILMSRSVEIKKVRGAHFHVTFSYIIMYILQNYVAS